MKALSYDEYQKLSEGAKDAFLLDAAIRQGSLGKRSLDDVMRKAYAAYSGDKGFTPAQFRALTWYA